jgi:hypothetical protein
MMAMSTTLRASIALPLSTVAGATLGFRSK